MQHGWHRQIAFHPTSKHVGCRQANHIAVVQLCQAKLEQGTQGVGHVDGLHIKRLCRVCDRDATEVRHPRAWLDNGVHGKSCGHLERVVGSSSLRAAVSSIFPVMHVECYAQKQACGLFIFCQRNGCPVTNTGSHTLSCLGNNKVNPSIVAHNADVGMGIAHSSTGDPVRQGAWLCG